MIYLDHASTSYKKPSEVSLAIYNALVNGMGNSGRGANEITMASSLMLQKGRETVCGFFHGDTPNHVIFKGSLTDALNTLMMGLLKKGDHVISSVMEHNSILRPLELLHKNHLIDYDLLPCDKTGKILIENISMLEKENTKAIILSQASNITGTIQPIKEVRNQLKNKKVFILIDTAQSAGYVKINFKDLDIDGLAFTGHKGLLGPQGVGGFMITSRLNQAMDPVFTGGTGSESLSLDTPLFMPDKFEAGTPNLPGIIGLTKGIEYISNMGSFSDIRYLTQLFLDGLQSFEQIKLLGGLTCENRVPTFSLLFNRMNPSEAAFRLENDYSIISRSGYHCAALAHRALGSIESGSLRISFGHFTTKNEVMVLLDALQTLNEV